MVKRKRTITAEEFEDKYYALLDKVENLRDRLEDLNESKTKKPPKDLAHKLDLLTEQLNELNNTKVIRDEDEIDDDWTEEDEEDERQLDMEMLADDIQELRDEYTLTQKELSARYKAETRRILSKAKFQNAQAKYYKQVAKTKVALPESEAKRHSLPASYKTKKYAKLVNDFDDFKEQDNWNDIPTTENKELFYKICFAILCVLIVPMFFILLIMAAAFQSLSILLLGMILYFALFVFVGRRTGLG